MKKGKPEKCLICETRFTTNLMMHTENVHEEKKAMCAILVKKLFENSCQIISSLQKLQNVDKFKGKISKFP